MKVEKDYEELLKLLNKHKVKYCIIGAYAVAFYVKPRYTKDLDIFIEPSDENGEKMVKALDDFGFKSLKLSAEDFTTKRRIIQLGYEPLRIDIITSILGCSFDQVWKNKVIGTYGKEKVYFIGIDELISTKTVSSRQEDKIDLALLLKAKKKGIE
jgi:predicted nucleotidyltransferase